ncbi:DUF1534 domain-containing protein [Pseudomonas caricapapayae]|nr:DUF1534 domain-containing protein [Pseudomonas caricapapayae]
MLPRGNALDDAPRHNSAPRHMLERGRRASRTACDAERRHDNPKPDTACDAERRTMVRLSFLTLQWGCATGSCIARLRAISAGACHLRNRP